MSNKSNFSKANKSLKKLPTKKQAEANKKTLLSYLSSEYGITYFNQTFVYKLQHINDGTLQNLQTPIAYDLLLEMFKYYKHYLDNQRVYNKKIGKAFSDHMGALRYDLAIVLGMHSDYISEARAEAARVNELVETISATTPVVKEVSPRQNNDNDEIDINNMLDNW